MGDGRVINANIKIRSLKVNFSNEPKQVASNFLIESLVDLESSLSYFKNNYENHLQEVENKVKELDEDIKKFLQISDMFIKNSEDSLKVILEKFSYLKED